MCVVLPRLSWQGRRCALPLHPSGSGAAYGIEPIRTNGEPSALPKPHLPKGVPAPMEPSRLRRGKGAFLLPLNPDQGAFALLWTPSTNRPPIGNRHGFRALNHDQSVSRLWTLHTGFAYLDEASKSQSSVETALSLAKIVCPMREGVNFDSDRLWLWKRAIQCCCGTVQ